MKTKIILEVDEDGNCDLSNIPNCYVPNWFSKSDTEFVTGVKLTDEEFRRLTNALRDCPLAEEISEFYRTSVYWFLEELGIGKRAVEKKNDVVTS